MTDYRYGADYKGRDLGWVACGSLEEAKDDLWGSDSKYLPGRIGRRALGPIEYNFDWANANNQDA